MVDVVDSVTRSRMMSGIRGGNTKPELSLRKALHSQGFRFRLHDRSLPGTPDIILPKWNAVVEVRGCFWHRHQRCRYATTPATRPEFWVEKFNANVSRDERNLQALIASGWRVAVVWECGTRGGEMQDLVERLSAWLRSGNMLLEIPNLLKPSSFDEA